MIPADGFAKGLLIFLVEILFAITLILFGITYLIAGIKGIKIFGLVVAGLLGVTLFGGLMKYLSKYQYAIKYKYEHPLIYYAGRCNVKKVEKYLKKGFDPNDIEWKKTPLIECFFYDDTLGNSSTELDAKSDRIVELLLEYGADPNLNAYEYYPSNAAIFKQRSCALKMMIEHGLVIDSINIERARKDGVNLKLASIAKYGYKESKPMQNAINHWSIDCLKILLESNAEGTIWFDDEYNKQQTLIMKAASFFEKKPEERIQVLDMLLNDSKRCGIDALNVKDEYGYTVLHLICRQRNYKNSRVVSERMDNAVLCDWLIKNGLDVNAVDKHNRTALHLVCHDTYPTDAYPLVKALVENGADVTMKDESGMTALDMIVSREKYYYEEEDKYYYPLVIELLTPKQNMALEKIEETHFESEVEIAKTEFSKENVDSASHLMLEDPLDNW